MTDIYEQHKAAFARVGAYVVLNKGGERVATVAIKFPKDGAGRLWAYCHVLGLPMQRQHVDGYGYDKRTPAVRGAFAKAAFYPKQPVHPHEQMKEEYYQPIADSINAALAASDGEYWDRLLEKAGFQVLQAV